MPSSVGIGIGLVVIHIYECDALRAGKAVVYQSRRTTPVREMSGSRRGITMA